MPTGSARKSAGTFPIDPLWRGSADGNEPEPLQDHALAIANQGEAGGGHGSGPSAILLREPQLPGRPGRRLIGGEAATRSRKELDETEGRQALQQPSAPGP